MASVGGHEVNSDEIFWQRYGEKIVEFIRKGDRLYLLAQTGSSVLGFLEGKIITLKVVFAHNKCFHISAASGQKNGQSDRKRNIDGIRSATKTPRHQDYIEIYSFHIRKRASD